MLEFKKNIFTTTHSKGSNIFKNVWKYILPGVEKVCYFTSKVPSFTNISV